MKGPLPDAGTGLEDLVMWWRSLTPPGRVRIAMTIGTTGAGALVGYLVGMRHLRLLMMAYERRHPRAVTGFLWLMDPVPHIWPYMLGGAAAGLLIAALAARLAVRSGCRGASR